MMNTFKKLPAPKPLSEQERLEVQEKIRRADIMAQLHRDMVTRQKKGK